MALRDRVWWMKGGGGRAWNLKVSEAFNIFLRVDWIVNVLGEKCEIKNPQAPRSTYYSQEFVSIVLDFVITIWQKLI